RPFSCGFIVRGARSHRHFMSFLDEFCSECATDHACAEYCDFHVFVSLWFFSSLKSWRNAFASCTVSAHCCRRMMTPSRTVQTCAKRALKVLPVTFARAK